MHNRPRRVVGWFFPAECAGCGRRAPAGLCDGCLATLRRPPHAPPPSGVDEVFTALRYEGAVREAIARLKYRNARACLDLLVDCLDGALPEQLAVDLVTWIPSSPARRRGTGFDHGEMLARGLAGRRRLPVGALLERRDGEPQTQRDHAARQAGPTLVARAAGTQVPRSVLIVDDVTTTGATLRNAATALRAQGCERVIGVAVARTLLKRFAGRSETPHGRGAATNGRHASASTRSDTCESATHPKPPRSPRTQ